MKAPLSWLKEYVEINCSPEELQDKLFSCGFEVEGMEYIAENVDKIVTCKILEIEKHQNADKLSVTKVDAGEYGILQIITSAKNIFIGATVPVALDGATLYSGDKINTGEIRGVKSEGMFCSGEELGINDDWYKGASVNGILILEDNLPLGKDIKEILDLNDVLFDINITANRPDCQSILGIAREVAAVLDKPFKMPDLTYSVDETISTRNTLKVEVEDKVLCPRYISHLVKDVKIEESPLWLKRRLFLMGIRSINKIVDITNYVLTEIGQPMHSFDLKDLSGKKIIVRRAVDGEKIETLDEKTFELSSDNLVICDGEKPVALAGIMGGLNSGIKDDTLDIVFESAKFARDNIRKSSRTLGQHSDSSARYEKGIDAYTTGIGMKRALHLIDELKCGRIASDEYDIILDKPSEKIINTTIDKVNAVLGIEVPTAKIVNILTRLGFGVETDGNTLSVKVPPYREDMESYPDIAEEIIREYGYDNIESTLLKSSKITNGGKNNEQVKIDKIKELLVGFGFNEIVTYSFVSEKDFENFGFTEDKGFIRILNPIGEDMAIMRTSLLPSIVKTVFYNLNRKNYEGRLFEFAKVYKSDKLPLEKLPIENNTLSMAVFGENENFFTLKGVVEAMLKAFCDKDAKYIPCTLKAMHPTRSAFIVLEGETVGYFGQINPEITAKFDIDKEVYAGEIYYDKLAALFNDKIAYKSISKFPPVERDLAFTVEKDVPADKITECIVESAGNSLESLRLFDIYQGDQIDKDKKSMAYNLIFVSDERTLNVGEIDEIIKNILKNLNEKLGAELR